jgi:hypothetical protein
MELGGMPDRWSRRRYAFLVGRLEVTIPPRRLRLGIEGHDIVIWVYMMHISRTSHRPISIFKQHAQLQRPYEAQSFGVVSLLSLQDSSP